MTEPDPVTGTTTMSEQKSALGAFATRTDLHNHCFQLKN